MFLRGPGLLQVAGCRHVQPGAFGIRLIGVVGLSLLMPPGAFGPVLGHIGRVTPLLLALYAVAMRNLFVHGGQEQEPPPTATTAARPRLRRAIVH